MSWRSISISTVTAIGILITASLYAQSSDGSIVGTVFDATGASVPQAQVTITDEERNTSQSRATDSFGGFVFPTVPLGLYTVSIKADGFRTYVEQHVEVNVGQTPRIDAVLQVGQVTEQIVVDAAAPLLETATSSVGQVIGRQMIADLPLNGRDFTQLATLTANITHSTGGFMQTSKLSVDGGRTQKTEFVLDGGDNTETTYNGARLRPSIDAIQEFKVESNSFSAVYGRSAAIVNVATKSGTNAVHGTAFEFLRNDKLDSRNFFALSKPPFRQNQFGASVGGPIVKNKLFFFADYEGLRVRKGITQNNRVGSTLQRSGDFSEMSTIFDPLTIREDPSGSGIIKDPFTNNQIPDNRISSVAEFFLPFIPEPNTSDNRFVDSSSLQEDSDRGDVRLDYTISEKDTVFGRYSFEKKVNFTPGPSPLTGASDLNVLSQNAVLSTTHLFSPNLFNEARLTFSRIAFKTSPQGLGTNQTVASGIMGYETTSLTYPGLPHIPISGYLGVLGRIFNPIRAWITGWQLTDHVTFIKNRHNVMIGFDHYRSATPTDNNAWDRGYFSHSGGFSADGFADYLLGYPNFVFRSFPRDLFGVHAKNYAVFVQDDWHVSSRFTLNLGLRYDVLPPQDWVRNAAASYDFLGLTSQPGKLALANDNAGNIDLTSQQVTAFAYPFVEDIVISARQAGIPDNLVRINWRNAAPRFGFAWRPWGDRTVIRGGFGVFYMLTQGLRSIGSGPINTPLQVDEALAISSTEAPSKSIANILPPFGQSFAQVGFSDLDPHQATPYMSQWNLSVQHQLTRTLAVEAAYTGNSSHKLEYTAGLNVPVPGPGNIASRRPEPRFGQGAYLANIGYGNFNSLRLRAEKRFSEGLSFLTTFVYGKAIDSNTNEPTNGPVEQDPSNRAAERGRSDFDVSRRLVASVLYDLPIGRGRQFMDRGGPLNVLLGGWRVTSIVSLQSGSPFTPIVFGDPANTGRPQRPNRLSSGRLDNGTIDRWFDVASFAVAPSFTYGNSGRNILEGPGLVNWDFGLQKEFAVREAAILQFRAEFFNFTNTPAFGRPDNAINSPTAGVIFTAGEPRDIQLGLKVIW